MGGGGSDQTTTTELPSELKPLASAYTSKALDLSNQSYQPYTGQRYADFTGNQNQALSMIQNRATSGNQLQTTAESALQQIAGGQTNPYLDAAVQKAQASALGATQTAGIKSGSFGNSGIAEAGAKQVSDIASSMYGNAYEGDQARRLQAISQVPTINQAGYTDAAQLLQAGQLQQNNQQQGLDFAYQQAQEAKNLPYKQLAAMGAPFASGLGQVTSSSGGGK